MQNNTQTIRPLKKGMLGWIIVIGLVLIVGSWLVSTYNSLVVGNQQVDIKWAQVENQLERRFALFDNLVATVKGASQQEQEVFGKIAEARTRYSGSATVDQKVQAANEFSALARLLVIQENYPNLQSIQAYRDLIAEISGTENRIAVERARFNETVGAYNVKVKTFPGNVMASLFGFGPRELFKADEAAQTAPKVDFN